MRIVKLGGSLLKTGQIFDCLLKISNSNELTIVVCGGGDFADEIRKAQKKWHFDDIAAHEMAILAMQQMAIMCQNLQPEFIITSSVSEIKTHRHIIWFPTVSELNAAEIPPTWEITSDSLAAFLAIKLNANKLVIVKSCDVNSELTAIELTQRSIVDGMFSEFVEDAIFDWSVISVEEFLKP